MQGCHAAHHDFPGRNMHACIMEMDSQCAVSQAYQVIVHLLTFSGTFMNTSNSFCLHHEIDMQEMSLCPRLAGVHSPKIATATTDRLPDTQEQLLSSVSTKTKFPRERQHVQVYPHSMILNKSFDLIAYTSTFQVRQLQCTQQYSGNKQCW